MNASKCAFGVSAVKFLGLIATADGVAPDPDKLAAIRELQPLIDLARARRFLGMLNHIGRFLPNLWTVTAPIRLLLNKDTTWNWGPAQSTAFESLKQMVTSSVCVARYNPELT